MTNLMDTQTSIAKTKSGLSARKRALISFALASAATLCVAANAAAQDKSKGVYRIPYENGTTVKVTNDHT